MKKSKKQRSHYHKIKTPKKPMIWTSEEDKILIEKAKEYNCKNWSLIASFIKDRTAIQCSARYKRIQPGITKGTWTQEEDNQLMQLYKEHGKNWSEISKFMPHRTGKQIRDRFLNALDDNLNKEKFTQEEDEKIIKLYKSYGNSWCRIAKRLKGRTGDMVKNRFYSSLKRIVEKGKFKRGRKMLGKKRGRKPLSLKLKNQDNKNEDYKNKNCKDFEQNDNQNINKSNKNEENIFIINKKIDNEVKYKKNKKNDSGINTNITIKNNNNDNNNQTINNNDNNNNTNQNILKNESSFTNPIVNNIININTLIIHQSNIDKGLLAQLQNTNNPANIIINNISNSNTNDSNDNLLKKNNISFMNNYDNDNNENNDDNVFWFKQDMKDNTFLKNIQLKNNNFNPCNNKNKFNLKNIEPEKIESLRALIKTQMTYGIQKDNLVSQLKILKELKSITNDKIKALNNDINNI